MCMDIDLLQEAAESLYDALYPVLSDFLQQYGRDFVEQEEGEALLMLQPYAQEHQPDIPQKYKEAIFQEMGYSF